MSLFSVLILTHRRPDLLRRCLASLEAADTREVREIIVAVNGEDFQGESVARDFMARIPQLSVIPIARQSRGAARNAMLERAKGEWLYFLDDDVEATPTLFADAAKAIRRNPEAWAIGGPNLTPPQSGLFERTSGCVLGSWIGAGPMRRRYAPGRGGWADERFFALCNLCARANAFKGLGLSFDPDLSSAEENLFIASLADQGRRALYDPDLIVYHRRRGSLGKFLGQVYESGVGRRQVLQKHPRAARAVFFFPALLLLYAVFLLAAYPPWIFWAPPALYALAVLCGALRCGLNNKSLAAPLIFLALVPLSHFSYAAGFLFGRGHRESYKIP